MGRNVNAIIGLRIEHAMISFCTTWYRYYRYLPHIPTMLQFNRMNASSWWQKIEIRGFSSQVQQETDVTEVEAADQRFTIFQLLCNFYCRSE